MIKKNSYSHSKDFVFSFRRFLHENEETNINVSDVDASDLHSFISGESKSLKIKKILKVFKFMLPSIFSEIIFSDDLLQIIGDLSINMAIEKLKKSGDNEGVEKLKKLNDFLNKIPNRMKKLLGRNNQDGIDKFKIDPKISMIVDDKIEDGFIPWLENKYKSETGTISNFNIDDEFNEYLKANSDRMIKKD